MPELPEVETVVRGLARRVSGDQIHSVWLGENPQTFKSPPAVIAAALEGARIAGVRRMGKHIVLDMEGNHAASGTRALQCIVHLGMTGKLLVTAPGAELEKHTHAIARLGSGRELRFVDPRRFGRLWVVEQEFATCGTEPLEIRSAQFAKLFRKRNTPIKSALLNQKLLRGVGNIYADESLFRAGIRPRRRAGSLTRTELRRLYNALRLVLRKAIAAGGSSVSDYVDVEGAPGRFHFQHRVYGRTGEPCARCGTPIKRIVVAGRGTHYCPKCQN